MGRRSSRPHPNSPNHASDVIYGRRPVWEVLRAGKRSLHRLWMVKGMGGGVVEEILQMARERGVPIDWVQRPQLDRMVHGNHQGIAAQAAAAAYLELDPFLKELPEGDVFLLGLDEIEDPQNMGAILRNAGFFGVNGVLIPQWRTAPVSEAALRASAGAAEHVPVVRVGNLVQTIDRLKEEGFEVWGADMAGEALGQPARGKRFALIMGSEGQGLRRLVKEHCDKLIAIPGGGKVGSLNVASAAAIFLYELKRPG